MLINICISTCFHRDYCVVAVKADMTVMAGWNFYLDRTRCVWVTTEIISTCCEAHKNLYQQLRPEQNTHQCPPSIPYIAKADLWLKTALAYSPDKELYTILLFNVTQKSPFTRIKKCSQTHFSKNISHVIEVVCIEPLLIPEVEETKDRCNLLLGIPISR